MSDLECNELVELVTAYLDGALDAEDKRRFVDHLALCDGCTLYLDQFRQTVRALGDQPAEEPTGGLSPRAREALLAAFREQPG